MATIRTDTPSLLTTQGSTGADVPTIYLPTEESWMQDQLTWIHWSVPQRAYPGIDVNYKLTGYDWNNRALSWSLDTAPSGMTINSTGLISWTPTSPAQDGDHTVTARLTAGITQVTKTWTVTVTTSNIIFMATTGNDTTGDGSIGAPYLTLNKALGDVTNLVGATIYLRGGTYIQSLGWGANANPIGGYDFLLEDSLLISGYPGESAIFDCNGDEGLTFLGSNGVEGVVLDNLEVTNALHAGVILLYWCVGKRLNVHDCFGPLNDNPAGIDTWASTLLDSCTAYDNLYSVSNSNAWNNSNFTHYSEFHTNGLAGEGSGTPRPTFWIDCISTGGVHVGFKIKRLGYGSPLHIHNSVSYGSAIPYMMLSNYWSVRHSIGVQNTNASNSGFLMGGATAASDKGYLIQDSLLTINNQSYEACAISIALQPTIYYTTTDGAGPLIKANQVVSNVGANIFGHGAPMALCPTYDSVTYPDILTRDVQILSNQIYAPSDFKLVEYGQNNFMDLATVNAWDLNTGNTYATVPATIDKDAAGTSWRWTSATNTLAEI